MSYAEHPAGARLAGWVECLWTIRVPTEASPAPTTVHPDGCMDVIFDLGPPLASGTWRSFLVGTMRSPETYAVPGGADLVGVRLRPGAARALAECDPADVVDERVALEDVWGREARLLEEALVSMPTRARLAALRRALEARLAPDRADPLVRRAVGLVEDSRGTLPVADVARAVGRSVRTLERRFVEATGVGPKELGRVVRFRRAMRLLRDRPDLGGARLAARCGYADQSHLIREFRALAGTTPTRVGAAG